MFCSEKFWTVLRPNDVELQRAAAEHVQCLATGFGINARLLQPVSVVFSKPQKKESVALPGSANTEGADEPKERSDK